jgi:hypothetical protein
MICQFIQRPYGLSTSFDTWWVRLTVHDRCRLPLITKVCRPCCNASGLASTDSRGARTESRPYGLSTSFDTWWVRLTLHDRCRLPLITKVCRPCCNASGLASTDSRGARTESRPYGLSTSFDTWWVRITVHDRCRLPLITKVYRPCCNALGLASTDSRGARTESRLVPIWLGKERYRFAQTELLGTSSVAFRFGKRRQV